MPSSTDVPVATLDFPDLPVSSTTCVNISCSVPGLEGERNLSQERRKYFLIGSEETATISGTGKAQRQRHYGQCLAGFPPPVDEIPSGGQIQSGKSCR